MYRYTLEPYKSMKMKFHCPNCHRKTFTRYIDLETQEYINEFVGRCDREIKCGYHYKPKDYFLDNNFDYKPLTKKHIKTKATKATYIKKEFLIQSIKNNYNNNFITFLIKLFGKTATKSLQQKYLIGSSKYWPSANIFWQMDIKNRIRTGKIMLYNKETGKRIKKPFNHIFWVHKTQAIIKTLTTETFNLQQCLFGEHLLKTNPTQTIGLVESEKTAIISSIFYPKLIWLATGGLNNLSYEKTKVLENRKIILFPDLNAFDKWQEISNKLSSKIDIKIYDQLESLAGSQEREKGYDIADYFLNEYIKHL